MYRGRFIKQGPLHQFAAQRLQVESNQAEMRRAGFDAIVVKGKAKSPVYLWVHDGEVELRKRFMTGLEYYRKNVPGYGNARLLAFASELGVRDSRRIRGEDAPGGFSTTLMGRLGEPVPVDHVDLQRYAGTWYEVARTPNRFPKQPIGSR